MTLRFGADTPAKLYLGADEVDKAYLGETEVYTRTRPITRRDGVRLTRADQAQFHDHFGFVRARGFGAIENQATSRCQIFSGHRFRDFGDPEVFVAWTGQPTSGTVYFRFIRDSDGRTWDFTNNQGFLRIYDHAPIALFASRVGLQNIFNAARGLPTGTLYIFSDSARTQIISMDGRRG